MYPSGLIIAPCAKEMRATSGCIQKHNILPIAHGPPFTDRAPFDRGPHFRVEKSTVTPTV